MLERTEQARADHEAALFECIGRGDLDGLTRLIVSEGTDPNARDASGKRALEVAALTRNADIVEALCDSGASLTIPNRNLEEKASGNEASEEQTSTTPDSPVEQSRIVVELVANLPAKVDQTVRADEVFCEFQGVYDLPTYLGSFFSRCGVSQSLKLSFSVFFLRCGWLRKEQRVS